MAHTYEYPRPAVTVDAVVFGHDEGALSVLLIERGGPPFRGAWALPGGFVGEHEDLADAVERELAEETGVAPRHLEQLGAWGTPGRDPRGHTITVAYVALVRLADHGARAATDAADARWFPVDALPALAFDHGVILAAARQRLRDTVRTRPVGFDLLPERFTLTELQALHEAVRGEELDKRNFRKRVLALGFVVPTDDFASAGAGRPARLHAFDRERYAALLRDGFDTRI